MHAHVQLLYWILALLTGLHHMRGVLARRCTDALYCMHHIDGVKGDIDREDLFSMCSKTMKLVTCVEASIKDCRINNIGVPKENRDQLSNSISQARAMYKSYCTDVTPKPNHSRQREGTQEFHVLPSSATCSEISMCVLDVTAFTNAISNGRSQDACKLIVPSVVCLQNAVLDCERRQESWAMQPNELTFYKSSLEDSRTKLNRFCVDDSNHYEPPPVTEPRGSSSRVTADETSMLGLVAVVSLVKVFVL